MVTDIRKSTFSAIRLHPGDDWPGPVIVKTDCNYGGQPERLAARRAGEESPRPTGAALWKARLRYALPRALRERIWHPLSDADCLSPHAYPIFASLREVPRSAFDNPHLIVERFVPERDGERYCIRNYVFLGTAGIAYRRFSDHPLAKGRDAGEREEVQIPDELLDARRRLGFDYGRFDYVMREGRPILLDVNTTPTWLGTVRSPQQQAYTEILAGGLRGLIAKCVADPASSA